MAQVAKPLLLNTLNRTIQGKPVEIKIQTVTENLIEPIVQLMVDHFLPREPVCSYYKMNPVDDPESTEDIRQLWRGMMKKGASIVALIEQPNSDPILVGANVTGVSHKDQLQTFGLGAGPGFRKAFQIVMEMYERGDAFKKCNVDKYLGAMGLVVHSDYHGLGLGSAILAAREPLCKSLGVTVTVTVFTASSSQYLAKKLNYEIGAECSYRDMIIDNEPVNMDGKVIYMYKKFE